MNFDGEAHLGATLDAAIALRDRFEEIVLVDNDSRDGSLRLVEGRYPRVRIVRLGENRGPGQPAMSFYGK